MRELRTIARAAGISLNTVRTIIDKGRKAPNDTCVLKLLNSTVRA